jgi:hypothetical protein
MRYKLGINGKWLPIILVLMASAVWMFQSWQENQSTLERLQQDQNAMKRQLHEIQSDEIKPLKLPLLNRYALLDQVNDWIRFFQWQNSDFKILKTSSEGLGSSITHFSLELNGDIWHLEQLEAFQQRLMNWWSGPLKLEQCQAEKIGLHQPTIRVNCRWSLLSKQGGVL